MALIGYLNHKEIIDEKIIRTIVLMKNVHRSCNGAFVEYATGH